MPNLLLTGASGYIAGTLLTHLLSEILPFFDELKIYALVRTEAQAESVTALGVHPLLLNFRDEEQLKNAVVNLSITIVVETVDPFYFEPAKAFIEGLSIVKQKLGQEVHFFHTSGAKLFSSHAGGDSSVVLTDTDPSVYEIQKNQKSQHALMQQALPTNTSILELADALDVPAYIIVPPVVYGPGEGFGNKISMQYVDLVRMGKKLGRIFHIDDQDTTWPFVHVVDCANLYITLLRSILHGNVPPHGKAHGFYFAENGVFSWRQISRRIAEQLKTDGLVTDATVQKASETDVAKIGEALGCAPEFVPVLVSGSCALRGENARQLGWKPAYGLDHLMGTVDTEVEFILQHDKK